MYVLATLHHRAQFAKRPKVSPSIVVEREYHFEQLPSFDQLTPGNSAQQRLVQLR